MPFRSGREPVKLDGEVGNELVSPRIPFIFSHFLDNKATFNYTDAPSVRSSQRGVLGLWSFGRYNYRRYSCYLNKLYC